MSEETLVTVEFLGGAYDGLTESKPASSLEDIIKLPISRTFIACTSGRWWTNKSKPPKVKITGMAWYTLQWRDDGTARYVFRGRGEFHGDFRDHREEQA